MASVESGSWSSVRGTLVTVRRLFRTAGSATLVAVVAVLVGGASPVFADPPRPTDYRTEIVSVTPAVPGLAVRIIGGDSFIEIDAPGLDVRVPGYQGEPYLHFAADGTVRENRRSPARWLNTDRYSQADVPAEADPDAPPEWRIVGSGGRHAWHDHRTHWMQETPPLGLGPGDQILDGVIPIVVDGVGVEIAVRSVWMQRPATAPWVVAALVAGLAAALAARPAGTRQRRLRLLALAAGSAALLTGGWQTWSLPSETGPPIAHWALPLSAVVLAGAAHLRRWSSFTVRALTLVAAVQVLVWTGVRRSVLTHAILPTSAPFWLDRVLTAAAGAVALVVAAASVLSLAREMRPAARAPGPTPAGQP
jgi:hypothetical protein